MISISLLDRGRFAKEQLPDGTMGQTILKPYQQPTGAIPFSNRIGTTEVVAAAGVDAVLRRTGKKNGEEVKVY